jgi:energy-coupling factor transporter transmembrane protein EcfT
MNKEIKNQKINIKTDIIFYFTGLFTIFLFHNFVMVMLYLVIYPLLYIVYNSLEKKETSLKSEFLFLMLSIFLSLFIITFSKKIYTEYYDIYPIKKIVVQDGKYNVEICKNGYCQIFLVKKIPFCKNKVFVKKEIDIYSFLGWKLKIIENKNVVECKNKIKQNKK